jgi:hypothetical protein
MAKFDKKQFLKQYQDEVKGVIDNVGKPPSGAGRAVIDKLMAIKQRRQGGERRSI